MIDVAVAVVGIVLIALTFWYAQWLSQDEKRRQERIEDRMIGSLLASGEISWFDSVPRDWDLESQ